MDPKKPSIRVLLVEDEKGNYLLTRRMFSQFSQNNYELSWAKTLEEGIENIRNAKYDVCLLDHKLKEDSGMELLDALKGLKDSPAVVMLTTTSDSEFVMESLEYGAWDSLIKGELHAETLERSILLALERKQHKEHFQNIYLRLSQTKKALRESDHLLRHALENLEKAQKIQTKQDRLRTMGEMASGIVHDFNNALSAIMGYSEILLTNLDLLNNKEKTKDYLETIYTSAEDASAIANHMRHFFCTRQEEETLQPIHLHDLIDQVISLTRPKWKDQAQISGSTIEIKKELEPVPPIHGIASELREALTNLVFNAVDAMPEGGTITFRTRIENGQVVLDVCDTGKGMSEETQRRCLEPFFTTKGEKGSGLGMAMVFNIVERHQGTLSIDNKPGRGVTFSIRFKTNQPKNQKSEDSTKPPPIMPSGLRVLVVDDERSIQDLLSHILARDGYTAVTAFNGEEALKLFLKEDFDLVLTDWAMPAMNGNELSAAIKNKKPFLPIIMISGFGQIINTEKGKPEGVDKILCKPIRVEELRAAIAEAVKEKSMSEHPAGLEKKPVPLARP